MRDGYSKYFDFAVIGSGVAGLRYALEVAKHGTVAVITKAEPHESNTNYAQGGVSAVLCPSDSVESHVRDTIIAGAYLCDEETVRVCHLSNALLHTFSSGPSWASVVVNRIICACHNKRKKIEKEGLLVEFSIISFLYLNSVIFCLHVKGL